MLRLRRGVTRGIIAQPTGQCNRFSMFCERTFHQPDFLSASTTCS